MNKTCNKCGILKPISEFDKRKGHKFGVHNSCKLCERGRVKKAYHANIEYYREKNRCTYLRSGKTNRKKKIQSDGFYVIPDFKVCTKCKKKKNIFCFPKDKYNKTGHRSDCLECARNARKQYLIKNKALEKGRQKLSRDNLKDCYIANMMGMKVSECPKELIELKKMHILIHRQTKEVFENEKH